MAKETDPSLNLPFVILHWLGGVPIPFPFPLNPQRVRWTFPAPVSVQRTAGRPYLNDMSGQDQMVASVTMQGTFGYMPSIGSVVGLHLTIPGSVSLKILETTIETFNAFDRQRKKDLGAKQEFLAPSRLIYWRVVIREFSYDISNQNPLLYFYTIRMDRLADLLSPAKLTGIVSTGLTNLGGSLSSLVGSIAA